MRTNSHWYNKTTILLGIFAQVKILESSQKSLSAAHLPRFIVTFWRKIVFQNEIPRHVRTFLKSTNLSRCLAIFRLTPHQIATYAHSRLPKKRDKPDSQAWDSCFLHLLDLCWLAQCESFVLPLLPSTRLRTNKTALTRVSVTTHRNDPLATPSKASKSNEQST